MERALFPSAAPAARALSPFLGATFVVYLASAPIAWRQLSAFVRRLKIVQFLNLAKLVSGVGTCEQFCALRVESETTN